MTTPPAISDSQPRNSYFVTTGAFESHRNISFRQPEPLNGLAGWFADVRKEELSLLLCLKPLRQCKRQSRWLRCLYNEDPAPCWTPTQWCAKTTRPELHPPPLASLMDFIGSCEGRWQRNEVALSKDGGVGSEPQGTHCGVDGSLTLLTSR
jgi:hypothetical protein